ncbi:MFS transporter [Stenotrophomonas sp. 24(2023)]|uniref:MFS transporter n=1 Tax=Stenotrophomonas sp. 24(2023) TaxID=3068324 RepID=UPI0027DED28E|nr:MFS transporter [Stenotrophomonas sp. 24(2023)]WMJ69242.1 MFS transporter [Stenotrophomonas sp. 24(2023)]
MTHRPLIICYILLIWFAISFITNLIGPLMPIAIADFQLSLTMAGFMPFSFFLAYGLISIPGGMLIEIRGTRFTLFVAFALNLLGALAIAVMPGYVSVVAGLFVIGLGMALLQVVINPLMRTVGGEQHFAFFSVMAQLVFGLASFLSPLAFRAYMQRPGVEGQPLAWLAFYWFFGAAFVLLALLNSRLPLPAVELKDDERAGTLTTYRSLLRRRDVRLFFLAIVAYVGTEQSIANWMSQFLHSYHGLSATEQGAIAVSRFWGLMALGCLTGLGLLKLIDSRLVLALFSLLALACLALALFAPAAVSLAAFPAAGFFLSVMFSVIFSLALNSVREHHGAFSGILCSGILGGAIVPLLIGMAGDHWGLRAALSLVFIPLLYILSVSVWARPLVRNQTLHSGRQTPAAP